MFCWEKPGVTYLLTLSPQLGWKLWPLLPPRLISTSFNVIVLHQVFFGKPSYLIPRECPHESNFRMQLALCQMWSSNTDVSIWLIVPRCCRFSFSTLVLRQCNRGIHYRWHFFPCLLCWQASFCNLHQHWFNIAVVADEILVPKLPMLTSGDPLDREDQQVLLSTSWFCSGIPCPCLYAKVYWWFWYCMVVFIKVRTINSV